MAADAALGPSGVATCVMTYCGAIPGRRRVRACPVSHSRLFLRMYSRAHCAPPTPFAVRVGYTCGIIVGEPPATVRWGVFVSGWVFFISVSERGVACVRWERGVCCAARTGAPRDVALHALLLLLLSSIFLRGRVEAGGCSGHRPMPSAYPPPRPPAVRYRRPRPPASPPPGSPRGNRGVLFLRWNTGHPA